MESDKPLGGEIINISRKESYPINYLAQLIGGKIQYLPPRLGDALHSGANISLAKGLLGWEPKVNFKKGIKLTKKWFQKNYEK